MKEAPGSSETSVLTRTTRRNNPEDTILNKMKIEVIKAKSIMIMIILDMTSRTAVLDSITEELKLRLLCIVEDGEWQNI
jgi:hypothetical protein